MANEGRTAVDEEHYAADTAVRLMMCYCADQGLIFVHNGLRRIERVRVLREKGNGAGLITGGSR